MTRLIDADKLYPDCMTKEGTLAISQSQIANAPPVEYTFEEAFQKTVCEQELYCPKRPHGEWIPIKYRPLTEEERIEFAEYYGIEFSDTLDEKCFDCPMPEDGQEILISTSWGVSEDVADNDIAGEGFTSYGLESNGDWDGVDAWMPKPEPYKEGGEKE